MSLREKAKEVHEAGKAERGNFEPTGAPMRAYQFWLKNTKSKKGRAVRNGTQRENFCHFWRVVAIWAPLMGIKVLARNLADNTAFQVTATVFLVGVILAAIVFGVLTTEVVPLVLAAIAAIIYIIAGLVSGGVLAINPEEQTDRELFWLRVIALVTLPVSLLMFLGSKIAVTVPESVWKGIGICLFTLAAALVVIAGLVKAFFAIGFWLFVIIGSAVAVLVAGFFLVSFLGEMLQGLRKRARIKADLREQEALERDEVADDKPVKFRKPSRLELFFARVGNGLAGVGTTIGDFVIFAAQVIRVNKWKICPLVTITIEQDKA